MEDTIGGCVLGALVAVVPSLQAGKLDLKFLLVGFAIGVIGTLAKDADPAFQKPSRWHLYCAEGLILSRPAGLAKPLLSSALFPQCESFQTHFLYQTSGRHYALQTDVWHNGILLHITCQVLV